MSLQACADIVRQGDPDRFRAALAAPVEARAKLFPFYAFNVEVARAPWVASEPMIGEMRLQWWRDALEEVRSGGKVRKHEVTTPLAEVLDPVGAELLDKLVQARRWDIYTEAFEDETHFAEYLDRTGGGLMWAAARALGGTDEDAFRRIGRAGALANFFLAIRELEARGRKPLADGRRETVARLAKGYLKHLPKAPKSGRPAALSAWRAAAILSAAARSPERVANGTLGESELRKRFSLLLASFSV